MKFPRDTLDSRHSFMPRSPHDTDREAHGIPHDFYAIREIGEVFPIFITETHSSLIFPRLSQDFPAFIAETIERHFKFLPKNLNFFCNDKPANMDLSLAYLIPYHHHTAFLLIV